MGAHLNGLTMECKWSPAEISLHINVLELRAIRNACSLFLPLICDPAKILTDNITCMYHINHKGQARSHSLYTEAMRLWNWCISHNVILSMAYLLGMQNSIGDNLSRKFMYDHQLEIHPSLLHNLFT